MKFVNKEFSAILEIKKSKFIAHLCPYSQFDNMMIKLRDEHPKARHFVYAYRYLNDFDQIVENSGDDGEPKGTSGKPTLNVLNGASIINSAVVVVRYFGGVKLGTGGLVKAYSDAVNFVIENSQFMEYEKLIIKKLHLNYSQLGMIEYLLSNNNINIKNKIFDNEVELVLEASEEKYNNLILNLPQGLELEDE